MDAVILAAGRGQRLADIVPNYVKPALPMDNVPMIIRVVEQAGRARNNHHERVIVVTAPQNTEMLCDILSNHNVEIIVQRETNGPACALEQGMKLVRTASVLVLMCDNVTEDQDIENCIANTPTVGVRYFSPSRAQRFTIWNDDESRWEEKVPVTSAHVRGELVKCWCGPLVLESAQVRNALYNTKFSDEPSEWLIGPQLNELARGAKHVRVSTYDIGTHEFWKDKDIK